MLYGLEPGVRLSLRALGRLETVAAERDVVTPARGEEALVELVVEREPFGFRGRVTDPAGEPLLGARVRVRGDGFSQVARTDGDGRFAFEGLYEQLVADVEVELPGWVTRRFEDLVLGPAVPALDCVLERGRATRARLVDESGAPAPATHLYALREGTANALGEAVADGVFAFRDLPEGEVLLMTTISGRRFEWPHDTSLAEATLRVPVHGRLVVHRPASVAEPVDGRVEVHVTDLSAPDVVHRALFGEDGTSGSVPLVPGRYRVEVVLGENVRSGERTTLVRTPAGIAGEVTIRAGEERVLRLE